MVYLSRVSRFVVLVGAIIALGSSCNVKIKTGTEDGGVFFSSNGGATWEQRVFVQDLKRGKKETIDGVDVRRIVMDPVDSRILYLALDRDGLYRSVHQGMQWKPLLQKTTVVDLAVDRSNNKRLIAALANQIIISDDAGKTWRAALEEQIPNVSFTAIRQSPVNASLLFVGVSDGRFLVSYDNGVRWAKKYQFQQQALRTIIPSVYQANRLYAATTNHVYRTNDGGDTWENITAGLEREHPDAVANVARLSYHPGASAEEEMLLFSSSYGLAYTMNAGREWTVPALVQPPKTVAISAIAIDPKNRRRLYYATQNALYRTSDGGARWQFFSLPFSRTPVSLTIDWYDSNNMYIGAWRVKK